MIGLFYIAIIVSVLCCMKTDDAALRTLTGYMSLMFMMYLGAIIMPVGLPWFLVFGATGFLLNVIICVLSIRALRS